MLFDVDAARDWCEAFAQHGNRGAQRIDRNGSPYLFRYFLAGWNPTTRRPGPSVFLHHFVASDAADAVHSHPWAWALSLILVGGYREHRCTADGGMVARDYLPGDVNQIGPRDRHRIDLLGADCWTLFATGEVVQPWNFSPTCEG